MIGKCDFFQQYQYSNYNYKIPNGASSFNVTSAKVSTTLNFNPISILILKKKINMLFVQFLEFDKESVLCFCIQYKLGLSKPKFVTCSFIRSEAQLWKCLTISHSLTFFSLPYIIQIIGLLNFLCVT